MHGDLFGVTSAKAQTNWETGIGNEEHLNSPTTGAVVGTTIGAPPAALTVYGQDMATPTGNVFLTDAPAGFPTSWRLLHNGIGMGRLFSQQNDNHFHLDGISGDLRFWTQGVQRMRINRTWMNQILNGFPNLDMSGFVGIGDSIRIMLPSCWMVSPW